MCEADPLNLAEMSAMLIILRVFVLFVAAITFVVAIIIVLFFSVIVILLFLYNLSILDRLWQ